MQGLIHPPRIEPMFPALQGIFLTTEQPKKSPNFIILQAAVLFPSPESFIEEAVFSPQYILASYVTDQMTRSLWLYLWAFYSVPWVYISFSYFLLFFFVHVPNCVNYCVFVAQFEVSESDCFRCFSFQDCLGYSKSFVFP